MSSISDTLKRPAPTSPEDPAQAAAVTPHSKRQRASLACAYCRSRKQKCDSLRPACSACTNAGQACVYDVKVKKRGLLPGYVRVLESLYGMIFSTVDGSEHAIEALLKEQSLWMSSTEDADHEEANELYSRWKKSSVCQAIEQRLGEGEGSSTPGRILGHGVHGEPASVTSELRLITTRTHHPAPSAGSTSETPKDSIVVLTPPSPSPVAALSSCLAWQRATTIQNSSINLALPPNSWRLLDIFFTFTTCWLPIVDRRDIFRTLEDYQDGKFTLTAHQEDTGQHAVLWALMAYASFQERAFLRQRASSEAWDGRTSPENLEVVARSLLPVGTWQWQRGHVQGCILLSLITSGRDESLKAWHEIGQACLALENPQNSKLRAVRAGGYIIDALLSWRCSMRRHMLYEDGSGVKNLDTDSLEEYEPWYNRTDIQGQESQIPRTSPQRLYSTFNMLLSLIRILVKTMSNRGPGDDTLLSGWYNEFYRAHRQTMLNSQSSSWTPQILTALLIYNIVLLSSLKRPDGNLPDQLAAEVVHLTDLWQHVFGTATSPAIFTLLISTAHDSHPTESLAPLSTLYIPMWQVNTAEEAANHPLSTHTMQSALVPRPTAVPPETKDIRTPIGPNQAVRRPLPETAHGLQYDQHRTAMLSTLSDPNMSSMVVDAAAVRSHYANMDMAVERDTLQAANVQTGAFGRSDQQLMLDTGSNEMFDLGMSTGFVDLDEFMYDLALRGQVNNNSEFMVNLGMVGDYSNGFDNMFLEP